MRPPVRLLLAAASLLVPLAWSEPSRADASSWMSAAAGVVNWKQGDQGYSLDPALQFDIGVGTTPEASFIFGGLFRVTPILGSGTDLALMARATTKGFQEGRFGVALDAGGYARFWGTDSQGFLGSLTLGAPLGFTLSAQAGLGTDNAMAIGVLAGFDFLRLTVYRRSMLDYWTNPYPPQQARSGDRGPGRF